MESSTFLTENLMENQPPPLKSNQTHVGAQLLLKEGFIPVSVRKLIATCDFPGRIKTHNGFGMRFM